MKKSVRQFTVISLMTAVNFAFGCKEDKDETTASSLTVQPQILKLPVAVDQPSLLGRSLALLTETSQMQSFTPTSIRLSISDISIADGPTDDWDSPGSRVYTCPGETSADCMVEVSNLTQFEDALNAEPVALQPGTYTKVKIGMCKEINGLQLVEVTGSGTLNGTTYITDPDLGIVAGVAADAKPALFKFGGCAIQIPLSEPIVAELSDEQRAEAESEECEDCAPTVDADIGIRLVFDSYNFAALGNASNLATQTLLAASSFGVEDSDCIGDEEGLFLCTQRTALYATDDKAPVIKRFGIALTDLDSTEHNTTPVASPDPTAYTAVIQQSNGDVIAAYTRRSVSEGAAFNKAQKGDENFLVFTKSDDDSYKFYEGATGDSLTYPAFKLENHTGTRSGLAPNSTVSYSATKID